MSKKNQQGATLVVGVILLSAITIVGLSSMKGGSMQERMASNQNNKAVALMAAQAGASRFIEIVNKKDR
jgi:type IV pilus assembly protein PilX